LAIGLALHAPTRARYDDLAARDRIVLNRIRVRLCHPLRRSPRHSRCGVASPAASFTTRPRGGRKTASRRARAGRTFPQAGAARNAARARTISRWWKSDGNAVAKAVEE